MAGTLQISSPAFAQNEAIPAKYTADGENISPPLEISSDSDEAESLVLIIDDTDAATDPHGPGKVYDHWVVFNIPPDTTYIAEGNVPSGAIQGANGAGQSRYTGPAPPTGTHRYSFRLYALRGELTLDHTATKEDVQEAMEPILISQAELVGTYRRPGA